MKQVFFTLSFLFITCAAFAQTPVAKKDVPAEVIKSYLSQNSKGAHDSVWTIETVATYKVHYNDGGKHYESQYFADGRWIKTFTELNQADLMPAIILKANELYPGNTIKKSYVELNNDGKFYVLDIVKDKQEMTIYFYTNGKFAK